MMDVLHKKPGELDLVHACLRDMISEQGSELNNPKVSPIHAPRPTLQVRVHMQLFQLRKVPRQEARHLQAIVP